MELYTTAAIARALGMTEREIKSLTKTGIIREGHTGKGLYLLEETAREILENYRRPEDERENVDYMTERAKLMRIKRLNEEYDFNLRKGTMHTSEDINLLLSKMIVSFRARLTAIPAKAAPRAAKLTDSADVFDLLKDLIDEALTELSEFDTILKDKEID